MDHVAALIERHFKVVDGELEVGGVPVGALAAQYGTPFFVYDRATLDRKLDLLRRTLPARFAISYSVKANPNLAVLQHFVRRGCGLEIASGGEYQLAVNAGCSLQRIIFAGPGKTEAELELVLAKGIGEIHVESMVEIDRVSRLSCRLGNKARIAVRVNPTEEAQGGAMRMGGKPAPFGLDEELLDQAIDRVLADPWIDFRGLHLFTGTQILDWTILITQYRKGMHLAKQITLRFGKPIHTLDFGGGLGVPYFPHEQNLDMDRLREGLTRLMQEIETDPALAGTELMVEPGRYLVAEGGLYVARVTDIKVSRGKKYVILDGGMNHHLAASGNLGQTIKRNYPIAVINRLGATVTEVVDIVGPLCTPLDTIGRGLEVPKPAIGDLIGIFQSGAYARTASPLGFLSHPSPPEVWVENCNSQLIRARGE